MAPCHRSWRNRDGDTVRDVVPQVLLRLWPSLRSCSVVVFRLWNCHRFISLPEFAHIPVAVYGSLGLAAMKGLLAVFPHF